MKTIDLYTWPTPNGHKIHIMMEETGTPYRVIPIDIGKGDQFKPEFVKISPNNKMPAMAGDAMDHVPAGAHPPDARPGAPLPRLCAGEARVRDEPLQERSQSSLW